MRGAVLPALAFNALLVALSLLFFIASGNWAFLLPAAIAAAGCGFMVRGLRKLLR